MNKHTIFAISATVVIAGLFCGCSTVEPPTRPVAYVFPTVRSLDSLSAIEERDVTEEQVRGWLARSGVYNELLHSGLQDEDCQLLVRGLVRGGYSELDARKAALSLKWLSISCLSDGRVELLIGYDHDHGHTMHAGMVKLPKPPYETIRSCRMPKLTVGTVWYGAAGETEREYVEMLSAADGHPAFWVKRLVFH